MYNLTFDNPYNRNIVNKLRGFRNKQQGYYIPTNIEPEHITHQYDPITITGGAMSGGANSYHSVSSSGVSRYPPDLFEPRYTLNRNKMVGNRMKGGSSDFMNSPFYPPSFSTSGIASYDSDSDVDDLGKVHSKRRGRAMKGGNIWDDLKKKDNGILSGLKMVPLKGDGLSKKQQDVLAKIKPLKLGGKKPRKKGGVMVENKDGSFHLVDTTLPPKRPKKEKKADTKLLKIFN